MLDSQQLPNIGRFRKRKTIASVLFTVNYVEYKTGKEQEAQNI